MEATASFYKSSAYAELFLLITCSLSRFSIPE